MIFGKVSGEEAYKAAFEQFKIKTEKTRNALLDYTEGKFFTTKWIFDNYTEQRRNALKQRPSRRASLTITPMVGVFKIQSLTKMSTGADDVGWVDVYLEGFHEDYDGAEIDLPELFPELLHVSVRGENISPKTWPEGGRSKVFKAMWNLEKHNGGLIEIVNLDMIDLTAEAAEMTRRQLAAERKSLLKK